MDSEIDGDLSIAERVRMFRHRRGLTQEEAAGLTGVSVSLWRKWETGARAVGRFSQLIDIAQTLRVTDLRSLTGQPFALGPDGARRHESIDAVRSVLLRHPSLLPTESPPKLDALERRVEQAWDVAQTASAFRYAQTGALLPELISGAERAVRGYDGRERRRAVAAAGSTYLLARAFTKWVGEHDLALLCAERSMVTAERGDDPALFGAAAWNMAQALSTRGDATEARMVVGDALEMLAPEVAGEHARAELLSSWGALHLIGMVSAVRDDDRAEARRLLTGAAQSAARLGADRNDYRMAFGPTNVAIHRVAYSVELGHSRSAVRGAAAIDVTRAPSVERRVSHRLDIAQSHTRLRADLPALRALVTAEQESAEQVAYSVTAHAAVREMLRRENAATRPILRPLAERLGVLA
jgi:transcriptional regulator with XRE-family HTH domain